MKHYTKENSRILNLPLFGNEWIYSEGRVRNAKRFYRKRERRALNRMVEELVVEELSDRHSIGYWEDKLDDAMAEVQYLDWLEECEYEDWEFYGDVEPDSRWFAARYAEVFKLVDEAEYQLSLMGR